MNAEKKKMLEEQLRKLIAMAEKPQDKKQPTKTRPGSVRVIRRRRGQPDMLIA
jgi:hypothetical protein